MKNTITGIWDGIRDGIKGTINQIISAVNGMIGGLNNISFKAPNWVPIIGGNSWGVNIPKIPMLAEGGEILQGGSTIVGEEGAELLDLPQGAKVKPLDKVNNLMGGDNEEKKIVHEINLQNVPKGIDQGTLEQSLMQALGNSEIQREIDRVNERNSSTKSRRTGGAW